MRNSAWLVLVIGLFIALGTFVYLNTEWVTEEIDRGPTAEVAQQPFFAAKTFLSRLNVEVELQGHFRQLDDANMEIGDGDVIVLVDAYGSLSPKRTEHLLKWVERGGQLIISASNPYVPDLESVTDHLFTEFGVSLTENEHSEDDALYDAFSGRSRWGRLLGLTDFQVCDQISAHTEFSFNQEESVLQINVLSSLRLHADSAEDLAGIFDDNGGLMLQFDVGEGMISFLPSLDLWKNHAIGCLDHAYILWQLASYSDKVWFLYSRDAPSLVQLLLDNFPLFVGLSLVLLCLWLWHKNNRIGPVFTSFENRQRRLLEHIDASARFQWRQNQGQALILSLREDVLRAMEVHYASIRKQSPDEQDQRLAAQARCAVSLVSSAMRIDRPAHPDQLIQTIQALKFLKENI